MKLERHMVLGILASACAVLTFFALLPEISLPYRIGPAHYQRWLLARRLDLVSVVFFFGTLGLGSAAFLAFLSARKRPGRRLFAGALAALAVLGALAAVVIPSFIHSGPNPQAWCFNNLRQIDSAKEQLVLAHALTNGLDVTIGDISPYIKNGFQGLKCVKGGEYTINAIGTGPRCSFHGSMSEREAEWKRAMDAQQAESTVPSKAAPSASSDIR
jgi:hypothetical protein